MSSTALDNLRSLIIRDDSGLAPLDITMLGRVAGRLEHVEMMLRHEQSKCRIRDTRKGEFPDEGQHVLVWIEVCKEWCVQAWHSRSRLGQVGNLWLPSPPPPEES